MGLVTEAFELIERALELAPNATDEDAYFRAFPLTGRAEILCALNRAEEALIDAEAALHARERSGNLQRISASHSAIGLTQLGLGDINGALGSLHKAVELSEEAYGSNHPVLRTPLRRLAKALRRAGNEQDATKIEMRYDELGRRLADLWPGSRQGSAEATK